VGGAITASTITTIVVFLPIVYLHGASSEMFRDQAWTVAFSLISSLVVAMLVIPMLVSTLFLERKKEARLTTPVSFGWYSGFLKKIIEKRILVLILSLAVLGGTALLIPMLGSEFMPKSESAEFNVELKLPEGTSLARTFNTASKTEEIIRELLGDKIRMIYTQSGEINSSTMSQASSLKGENTASLKVILTDEYASETESALSLVENYLKSVPDLDVTFTRDETALQTSLGTTEAPFALEISGDDYSEIERILNESREIIEKVPALFNITTSLDEGTPEVEVAIDRFKTSYYNVTVENVISQVRGYLTGASAGSFEQGGELKDITIKLGDISLHQLRDIMITAGSVKVPLSELANIRTVVSPREITRRNQSRTSYIYANVKPGIPFDKAVKDAGSLLKAVSLPVDYKLGFTGEELKRKESASNLSFALVLSLILVFMVLAAQFESLLQPFVIMLSIPLAGVGTILTFFLLGKSLNMMAYIGIIMLGGIAVNNTIMLIDVFNTIRQEKNELRSLLQAGQERMRPICMTILTNILGILPMIFQGGESGDLWAPMAITITGGLIVSTIIILFVFPAFYLVLRDIRDWLSQNSSHPITAIKDLLSKLKFLHPKKQQTD